MGFIIFGFVTFFAGLYVLATMGVYKLIQSLKQKSKILNHEMFPHVIISGVVILLFVICRDISGFVNMTLFLMTIGVIGAFIAAVVLHLISRKGFGFKVASLFIAVLSVALMLEEREFGILMVFSFFGYLSAKLLLFVYSKMLKSSITKS